MKSIKVLAATIAMAAVTSLAAPALAAAPPAAVPPAAPEGGATVSAEQLQGVDGTRLVFRNTTDKTLMLFSPDGGVPSNTREHYMATLSPEQEYTFSGYNTGGNSSTDVYVRVYTVKKNAETGDTQRDTMVATIGAHNPNMGYPFIRVTAGKYWHDKTKQEWPHIRTVNLSQHETHDSWKVQDGNKFRAWIHRDGDAGGDDFKTLKLTLQDIDTAATLDMRGGGAAPA